jgi:3-hydroxyacyl-CoA dehydrogenase / enoyl-CoA hydratase / 3-hydroxybutyryl-CoA epimerase
MNLQHWTIRRDERGIAWVTIDRAGESTNALSADVMAELAQVLDALDREPPKAAIFRSAKAAGFIAGADINEFTALATQEGAKQLVERGWTLFNRLAAVRYPTLALVKGHCLGGGLELALACRTILAVDEPSTKLALPEVMLGIFPGWGGMLRLPERVGPQAALDMMLTGKQIDARRAKRMGLVDFVTPERLMDKSAADYVLSGASRRPLPFMQKLLGGPLKGIVANGARKQVAKKARPEHYPAPYAIIDMWAKHGGNALAAPELIDGIVRSPTAKNLVRVFHLQERLKSFGKDTGVPVRRVHVIGAGVMGGDIAAWCALRGLAVTLQDMDIDRIAPAIGRAQKMYERRMRGDKLRIRNAMDRLIPDPSGSGAAHADVVIEAIVENLDIKRKLFAQLEAIMRPDAVLASNTSSLKLSDLQAGMTHPSRLVGIHFFNPVAMMPLVEVVEAVGTDPEMLRKACAFVKRIDKLPLPVKDAPGFLVNAVLAPYMQEAMRAVDEGIAPEAIDSAMVAFGMPMGPIELADTVGLDIALHAGKQLAGPNATPPRCLVERTERGDLGRKSGKGFYVWADGRIQRGGSASAPSGLADRLVKPLLDRTRQLVADGVVADAELADAGVIFGTGFAPFTGGPMHYLEARKA